MSGICPITYDWLPGGEDTVSSGQEAASSQKSHKKLTAWQKAMDLVVAIYNATARFPKEEMFGLI